MANKLVSRPARKKSVESSTTLKPDSSPVEIAIDYPLEEELVLSGHYAIRINATPESQVEVSINDEGWLGCRTALGYYWFDWSPVGSGEMIIKARVRSGTGRWKMSADRFCRVVNLKKA